MNLINNLILDVLRSDMSVQPVGLDRSLIDINLFDQSPLLMASCPCYSACGSNYSVNGKCPCYSSCGSNMNKG